MQIERDPSIYDFHRRMEAEHEFTGPQEGHRHFFRGDISTIRLFEMHEENKGASVRIPASAYEDGGCSESCELFETIVNAVD
jgi:hypothetical protein